MHYIKSKIFSIQQIFEFSLVSYVFCNYFYFINIQEIKKFIYRQL